MDHNHAHDHDHTDDQGHSLYDSIDKTHVWCLNEETPYSSQKVLKEYEDRFSLTPSLRSQEEYDDDEEAELLLHIPFKEAVTIKFITIRGLSSSENRTGAPKKVRFFVDREDMDFESAQEMIPIMKLDLMPPEHDLGTSTIDYPVTPAGKFQNISSLTLYFKDNFGNDELCQTEITFIGFKGKSTSYRRKAVECVYESRGMIKDHKVSDDAMGDIKSLF